MINYYFNLENKGFFLLIIYMVLCPVIIIFKNPKSIHRFFKSKFTSIMSFLVLISYRILYLGINTTKIHIFLSSSVHAGVRAGIRNMDKKDKETLADISVQKTNTLSPVT